MAEVLAIRSSVTAVIQVSAKIIELCKYYMEAASDAPSDLKAIFIETSTIKLLMENLQFLAKLNKDNGLSMSLGGLLGANGCIEGCQGVMVQLEKLFPTDAVPLTYTTTGISKQMKARSVLTMLAWPLKEKKARKLLEQMIQYKTTINLALTVGSIQDIKAIEKRITNIHESLTESQHFDVYRWLQSTDPSPLHHRACKQYETGTGDWMLRSTDWQNWLQCKQRCLWIYGIPGAGKTILFSHLTKAVAEHLKNSTLKKSACIYYYCYFGHDEDESVPFLRWIINRLCREADAIPSYVYELYKHGGQPSVEDLLRALEEILEHFDAVYVGVDAIDESLPRHDLLRVVRDLATDSRFKKIQLLATSRQYIDIEKVMMPISVPISMRNPLVDEDIKKYVRSQVLSNEKIKYWPQHLRDEAIEALSAGAKGMFRWAACQIDMLRRLRGDNNTVRNALATLPKTLDETYERIFLGIANDDRAFVHCALKWVYYNSKLFNYGFENISCHNLLQAIQRSTAGMNFSPWDHSYDEESLRELCGCLITVTPKLNQSGEMIPTVSFAHYTVWEFLNSPRIMNTYSQSFAVIEHEINLELSRIVILETLSIHTNIVEGWHEESEGSNEDSEGSNEDSESLYLDMLDKDFNIYCAAASVISIHSLGEELSRHVALRSMVYHLLDASKPHFQDFEKAVSLIDVGDFWTEHGISAKDFFWIRKWRDTSKFSKAATLLRLFDMDETYQLAEKFVRTATTSIENVIQCSLKVNLKADCVIGEGGWADYEFEGSIMELCAQFADVGNRLEPFRMLLDLDPKYFDPSTILMSYIGSHDHYINVQKQFTDEEYDSPCNESCPLSILLKLGANVNTPGYIVTPLQIAVVCWDFEGVKILLEAGADPNNTGDSDGAEWKEDTPLSRFNHLHGVTPRMICDDYECIYPDSEYDDMLRRRVKHKFGGRERIAALLHQYQS